MIKQLKVKLISVTPFQQNCILLFGSENKKGVLIDPGGDLSKILSAIRQVNVTIEAIWITHGHIDHAGAAMDARDSLNIKIFGPQKEDEPLLHNMSNISRCYYGFTHSVRNCFPDQWLHDGEEIFCAGHIFKVLHCPGHTPGHVIYFSKELRFAIMGDVLFRGSIGRTDLPGGNYEVLINTLRKKILPLGDDIRFLCGHGPGSTFGRERETNQFLQTL